MKLEPTTLVLFGLATIGTVYIATESTIGRPLRIAWAVRTSPPWSELPYCQKCSAFWIAIAWCLVLAAGAPAWSMLPFAAVGLVRVTWGLIEAEPALEADAESLRPRQDGRPTEATGAAGDGTQDRDGPREAEAGAAEESAVRAEEDAARDGEAQHERSIPRRCRCSRCLDAAGTVRPDGTCDCCVCRDLDARLRAAEGARDRDTETQGA